MELPNSVVVAIVSAIVIVPIWLIIRSVNRKKKQLVNGANQLRDQYQLNFSDTDHWDNIVIGMDKAAGKLLWFITERGQDNHLLIDLRKMRLCKPINIIRSVSYNKENSQVIAQLALELVPNDSAESPILLEFYNEHNAFMFGTQLQLQAKWQRLISSYLAA